ncbi:MAG: MerR family transcriptional regulator [Alphaproteobacteria bacterium]|nr:MerR family transcriptional regulator [Alphaproteobacteria bacterium]
MMKADGAYRTITEVADLLQVQASVLRFWETQFYQIKPIKRMGGRRYYRAEDVVLLAQIRDYLYKEGLTIKGVQKRLKQDNAQDIPVAQLGKDMQAEDAFVQEVIDIKSYLSDYL